MRFTYQPICNILNKLSNNSIIAHKCDQAHSKIVTDPAGILFRVRGLEIILGLLRKESYNLYNGLSTTDLAQYFAKCAQFYTKRILIMTLHDILSIYSNLSFIPSMNIWLDSAEIDTILRLIIGWLLNLNKICIVH